MAFRTGSRWAPAPKFKTITTQPQLEDGIIYLDGADLPYVYDLNGKLYLEFDSVCTFFHIFGYHYMKMIDPEIVYRYQKQVSKTVSVGRHLVGPKGAKYLANRAVARKDCRVAILKLFMTYGPQKLTRKKLEY